MGRCRRSTARAAAGAVQRGMGSRSGTARHGEQERCGVARGAGAVRRSMGSRSGAVRHGQQEWRGAAMCLFLAFAFVSSICLNM
jgi:hypothetical protein